MRIPATLLFSCQLINPLFSQNLWMTRNLLNTPLEFRMHKDSIDNIHEIIDGGIILDDKKYFLADSLEGIPNNSSGSEPISKYILVKKDISSELYATLDFVYDRLFGINIYSNDPYYLNNFYLELKRHFKNKGDLTYRTTTDSTQHYGNLIVSYGNRYSEFDWRVSDRKSFYYFRYDLLNQVGYISISDKRLNKKFPSFCGYGLKKIIPGKNLKNT